jgi:FMN reductase
MSGIYVIDSQVSVAESGAYEVNAEIGQRLDQAVDTLVRDVLPAAEVHAKRFSPVHFSQVRCSV